MTALERINPLGAWRLTQAGNLRLSCDMPARCVFIKQLDLPMHGMRHVHPLLQRAAHEYSSTWSTGMGLVCNVHEALCEQLQRLVFDTSCANTSQTTASCK